MAINTQIGTGWLTEMTVFTKLLLNPDITRRYSAVLKLNKHITCLHCTSTKNSKYETL